MRTLLVAIDFSPITREVIDTAVALGRPGPSQIVLVHVVRPPMLVSQYGGILEVSPATEAASNQTSARLLEHWEAVLRRRKLRVRSVQLDGSPSIELLRQARKVSADMIVMGSHGHTPIYDLLIGATASGVLRRAACPVVIVPASSQKRRRKSR